MKKLNPVQLEEIRSILRHKGIIFFNIQEELLDHIASEIEEKMAMESLSFEASSKAVLGLWENSFRLKQNRLLLGKDLYPKIIYEELKRNSVKMLWPLLLLSLVLTSLLVILNYETNELFKDFAYLIGFFSLTAGIISLFLYPQLKNGKQTIYSHLLLKDFKIFIPMATTLILQVYEQKLEDASMYQSILFSFFMAMMLCFLIYLVMLYLKHLDLHRKYALS